MWGRGIACAACNASPPPPLPTLLGLRAVGLVRVQATTLLSNARSARVLEACGFEREGLLRRYRMVRGTPGDFWIYSRLAVSYTPSNSSRSG